MPVGEFESSECWSGQVSFECLLPGKGGKGYVDLLMELGLDGADNPVLTATPNPGTSKHRDAWLQHLAGSAVGLGRAHSSLNHSPSYHKKHTKRWPRQQ